MQRSAEAVRAQAGRLRLTIRDEGRCIVTEVADAGPGIAAQDRAGAVVPLSHLDPARRRDGSGLGPAIAQPFAEASGGVLVLADASGSGLLVRLTLSKASICPRRMEALSQCGVQRRQPAPVCDYADRTMAAAIAVNTWPDRHNDSRETTDPGHRA